jgi:periplasmic protein TonB
VASPVKGALLVSLLVLCAGSGLSGQESQSTPPQEKHSAASQSQSPTRVRISSGVAAGLLMVKSNPAYPEKARKDRIQGAVVLHAIIDKKGDVASLDVVSGDPVLAKAAIKAVKKWKYLSYLINGQPVEIETIIQVNFTLSGG